MRKKTTEELISEKPPFGTFKEIPRNPISVVLVNVRSLQNVGLCFRICDAIKARKLYLAGFTGYPPLPKNDPRRPGVIIHAKNQIEKTAIRTVEYVPWEYWEDAVALVKQLKKAKYQIVAVEQTWESKNFLTAHYKFPLALVLGHEREGVEDPVLSLCDFGVEIPILGLGNSLNVAMATTVVGYHLISKLKRI